MRLESFINSVKKYSRQQKSVEEQRRYDPSKPIPNLIDATAGTYSSAKTSVNTSNSASRSTSINAIAQDFESQKSLWIGRGATGTSWENCKCLKKRSERLF